MSTSNHHQVNVVAGRNLKVARIAAGLTQTELGFRVSQSTATIHRYENATRKIPLSLMPDFARVLEKDISFLLSEAQPDVEEDSPDSGATGSPGQITAKTREFDVLLVYFRSDEEVVMSIARRLLEQDISVWIQSDKVPPGRWIHGEILKSISDVRTVAIILSSDSPTEWELWEARTIADRCLQDGVVVIPVMLPGTHQIPDTLSPLERFVCVRFNESVHDEKPFSEFVWGIKGTERNRSK